MPNLRILSDNAADRAVVTALSTTANFPLANLKNDQKALVWRSPNLTTFLKCVWSANELVNCVVLPFCNVTQTCQVTVSLSIDSGATYFYSTGTILAATGTPQIPVGFTSLQASTAYAYGGGSSLKVYFPVQSVNCIKIDIVDTNNLSLFIESSRLLVGNYWSPTYNASYGASIGFNDSSEQSRTHSGDLLTRVGPVSKMLSFSQQNMAATDRSKLLSILRANRLVNPIFVSLFPENADTDLERDHQIYGKLSQMSKIAITMFNAYSGDIELAEV
jgi:hypothetical protein